MLHVRRFFCTKSTCAQKIFTERLPELCRPHAQRTIQLQKALCQLGLASGGQAGAEIGSEQGFNGSRDTILRLVRRHQLPDPPKSPIVGIDDWAWKRRQRYGTLICDLESRQPIDLLADRSVETVSAWFQAHPHVEVVSRDGSSEYASAITKGAPHARQVTLPKRSNPHTNYTVIPGRKPSNARSRPVKPSDSLGTSRSSPSDNKG